MPNKSYVRPTAVQQRVFGENVMDVYHGVPENERLPPPAPTDVAPSITVREPRRETSQPGTEEGPRGLQRSEAPHIAMQESSPGASAGGFRPASTP